MPKKLPYFATVTEPELRAFWAQYRAPNIRRLLLEVARYRQVLDEDVRGVPKWLDEANGTISAVCIEEASRLCCQIGAQAYFDRDSLSVEMVHYFQRHNSSAHK